MLMNNTSEICILWSQVLTMTSIPSFHGAVLSLEKQVAAVFPYKKIETDGWYLNFHAGGHSDGTFGLVGQCGPTVLGFNSV